MANEYGPETYGESVADVYDAWYTAESESLGAVSTAVAFLGGLAGDGPALELGIGTGRLALPLQQSGVEVHGIDASAAMVAKLRSKPGGDRIPVTMGDFRDFSLETRYRLIYVVFNTFFGLLSQEDQVKCFRAIARHLTDNGVFAIEAFVPDLSRFDRGQRVSAIDVGTDEVRLDVTSHDAAEQRSVTQHVVIREDGVRMFPVRLRYAYPSELDLMARLVGLWLRERVADWQGTPFRDGCDKHISVYELAR